MKKAFFLIFILINSLLFSKTAHYMTISKTLFSKNGKYVYSASFDSTGIMWNVKTGSPSSQMKGQRGFMTSMAISDKYKILLSTARDKTIAMRKLDGKLIKIIRRHSDAVNYVLIKDNLAVTASDNGEIFLWKFPAMYRIGAFKFRVPGIDSLSLSKKSAFLAAGCVDGFIRIINVKTRRYIKKIKAHENYIYATVFVSPYKLLTSSNRGIIKLWDLKTFKLVKSLKIQSGIFSLLKINTTVYAGAKNGNIYSIDAKTLEQKQVYKVSSRAITALDINNDEKLIAAGDESGAIYVLKFPGFKKVKVLGR